VGRGIFWRDATRQGAVAGMLSGLGISIYYMLANAPSIRAIFKLAPELQLWFGIVPVSSGVFGVFLGFAVTVAVSLLTRGEPAQASAAAGEPARPQ
jgi:cation/acetate symporter